jgi:proliferating cell nuclear antigen
MKDINNVKLVLSDASAFKDAITNICSLVSETNITLKATHLEIVAMDPANVSLLVFKMTTSEFAQYNRGGEEDVTFGLKLTELKSVLARGKNKDDVLTLSIDGNQLKVSFVGKSKKDFTLPLIDTGTKVTKVPELKFNAEVTIDNAELRDAVDDVAVVSDAVEFRVKDGLFVVSGSGDQSKAMSETKGAVKVIIDGLPAKSKYSLEYINKMLGSKLSKNVKVNLGDAYPLKLSYVNDKGSISLMHILAPRVDND